MTRRGDGDCRDDASSAALEFGCDLELVTSGGDKNKAMGDHGSAAVAADVVPPVVDVRLAANVAARRKCAN